MPSPNLHKDGAMVMHITSAHPVTDTRIFHKECKALAAAGYEVALAVAGAADGCVDGIRIIGVRKKGGRWARAVGGISRLAGAVHRNRPRVVHFHDPELLPLGIALRLLGKAVVYDVHEWNLGSLKSRTYLPRPAATVMARLVWTLEQLFARTGGYIVAATPYIASQFPGKRTIVVRNYPDLSELGTAPSRAEAAGGLTFCYVGVLSPERCGNELLTAATRVIANNEGVRLVMAGPLQEIDIGDVTAIEHRGVVDRRGVSSILTTSNVGVVLLADLPNYEESLPTKFFEYLAAGLPVIANATSRIVRSIINDEKIGLLVDGTDPNSIAEAMQWMLDNPIERQRMGARARELSTDLSWSSEASRLVELYDQVLSSR